jgi:uncharacterized protein YprB with RNaseH-like and TPR domain
MTSPRAKILLWDIETRGLQADYGSILCIGWSWLGEKKVQVKSIHDIPGKHPLDDKALIRWFVQNVWNKADIAVGWYSSGHDEPFLRTRSVLHNLEVPKQVTTLDLWGKVWKRFKFSKNSLDNVSRHLKIGVKYYSPPEDFEKVLWGDKAAMRRIVKHCKIDVELTVKAYKKFAPYVVAHPRVTFDNTACRVCGSSKIQLRGWNFSALKGKTRKVQCQDCGAWDSKSLREAPDA